MNLKAIITVHFEAEDALARAAEQARIADKIRELTASYPMVGVTFSERRPRQKSRARAPSEMYHPAEQRVQHG